MASRPPVGSVARVRSEYFGGSSGRSGRSAFTGNAKLKAEARAIE
ncbi:hypothetical protein QUB63_08930 [Microcoleus sp. ARI1-B5]